MGFFRGRQPGMQGWTLLSASAVRNGSLSWLRPVIWVLASNSESSMACAQQNLLMAPFVNGHSYGFPVSSHNAGSLEVCPSRVLPICRDGACLCCWLAAVRSAFKCVLSVRIESSMAPASAKVPTMRWTPCPARAHKAVEKALVRTVASLSIPPTQISAEYMHDTTNHPTHAHPHNTVRACRQRRLKALKSRP